MKPVDPYYSIRKPCSSCPYRQATPMKLWHKEEFLRLLAQDANPMTGAVYGCHLGRNKPPEERRVCAGWLVDQRNRGVPSIQLRLAILKKPEAGVALTEVTDGGDKLYDSIEEMCAANGVRLRVNQIDRNIVEALLKERSAKDEAAKKKKELKKSKQKADRIRAEKGKTK